MNELKVIIKEPTNGKASGYDHILNGFLKLSTERILKLLLDVYNLALMKNLITSKWCLDMITPSKSNPDNYRGICAMNSLLNVLWILMNKGLDNHWEENKVINIGQIGNHKEKKAIIKKRK